MWAVSIHHRHAGIRIGFTSPLAGRKALLLGSLYEDARIEAAQGLLALRLALEYRELRHLLAVLPHRFSEQGVGTLDLQPVLALIDSASHN